jgi:hypothetical protein
MAANPTGRVYRGKIMPYLKENASKKYDKYSVNLLPIILT